MDVTSGVQLIPFLFYSREAFLGRRFGRTGASWICGLQDLEGAFHKLYIGDEFYVVRN